MRRTKDGLGYRIESERGWFYLGLRSRIYALHLALGRLTITLQRRRTEPNRTLRAAIFVIVLIGLATIVLYNIV